MTSTSSACAMYESMPLLICSSRWQTNFFCAIEVIGSWALATGFRSEARALAAVSLSPRHPHSLGFLVHPFGGPTATGAMVVDPATLKNPFVEDKLVVLFLRRRTRWPLFSCSPPSSGVSFAPSVGYQ